MSDLRPRAAALNSAALSDAVGRLFGHVSTISDLVSPTPGRVLFGRAATVRFAALREDVFEPRAHSFARFFHEAVGRSPSDKVLVLSTGGRSDLSVGGGVKLSRLDNHSLAGLLTDGRLRDFRELSAYAPAFYCRGETHRAGTGDIMPVEANGLVTLGDATIIPGDYLFADAAGAVVVPVSAIEDALTLALEIQADDARYLEAIRLEDPHAPGGAEP
ncbi:RraA family protein [Brevundimonas sp.]|uniref:RraA family protein n=1 Tax=Brevundimonas sp. TaxID=1871086 RepID=UPI00356A6D50